MAIDASIYRAFAQPQRSAVDYAGEFDKLEADRANQRDLMASNALARTFNTAKLEDFQAQRQRANALAALQQSLAGKPDTEVLAGLRGAGQFDAAGAFEKGMLDRQETQAKIGHTKAQTTKEAALAEKNFGEAQTDALKRYRGALDYIDSPAGAQRWLQAQYADPLLASHMQALGPIEKAAASIPQDQAGFEQWRQRAAMGMEGWLKQKLEENKAAETGRHNVSTERNAAGQLAVAQGNLGVARAREGREASAPKGQIVQTDQGTLLVDPRTGSSTPVVGPDGKPVGPKLRDVPASAQAAMVTNATNLRRAELALKLAEGTDVGVMQGDRSATGIKGILPDTLLQRVDPKGVDARAAIADIGSLVIHDRSGAAVTASEFPRLAPFIPNRTDDAETVKKKLRRFVQVYREEISAQQEAYGPASGYRGGPAAPGGAPAPAAGGGFRYLGKE